MTKSAQLKLPDGRIIELPVIIGSEGERAIDITNLRGSSAYIALDNGFANTGSCKSAITFIDGEKCMLRYRGIPIQELAQHSTFLETSYLLIYGELPTKQQLHSFTNDIDSHTLLHEDMKRFFDGFPRDAHPMAILSSVVSACHTFYQEDWDDPQDEEKMQLAIIRLLAKVPTMAAFSYKKSIGQAFIYPKKDLPYCANFLNMMFATLVEDYYVDPEIAAALEKILILHADHEQNCSTSTVRLVGSSLSNLYASISAGIGALWGPLHGGANQRVIEMLQEIVKEGGNVQKHIDMAKDKSNNYRLYGFGHRVYKNYDPRADVLRDACGALLNKISRNDPLLDAAKKLEEITLKDDYFLERKLYPNVDFYSGIIYSALNIPIDGFTAMFALGRLPGWIAQWREMMKDPKSRIGRPRQIYIGKKKRPYIPIEQRRV